MRSRIAVLASGGGTNLQAILEHFDAIADARAGDVVLVASDRPNAGALRRAEARGIATALIETASRAPGSSPLDALLDANEVDVVALAGYLRLVPAEVVQRYEGRMVNVHPALLPAFGGPGMYGTRVHQAVLDAGSTISGVSVHFVDQSFDRGPIIAQWPVPIVAGDTPASLAARVLGVEHLLYPLVVDAVAAGRVALDAGGTVRRVRLPAADRTEANDSAFIPSTVGPRLATEMARLIGL